MVVPVDAGRAGRWDDGTVETWLGAGMAICTVEIVTRYTRAAQIGPRGAHGTGFVARLTHASNLVVLRRALNTPSPLFTRLASDAVSQGGAREAVVVRQVVIGITRQALPIKALDARMFWSTRLTGVGHHVCVCWAARTVGVQQHTRRTRRRALLTVVGEQVVAFCTRRAQVVLARRALIRASALLACSVGEVVVGEALETVFRGRTCRAARSTSLTAEL